MNKDNTQPTNFNDIDIPKEHWNNESVQKWCKVIGIPESDIKHIRDNNIKGRWLVLKKDNLEKELKEIQVSANSAFEIYLKFNPTTSGHQVEEDYSDILKHLVDKCDQNFFKSHNIIATYGKDFPLEGRKETMDILCQETEKRFKNRSETDQKIHPILVATGSPGIGKTRVLVEYPKILESKKIGYPNYKELYVSYGNGTPFQESDELRIGIVTSFCLRIIAYHNKLTAPWDYLLRVYKKKYPSRQLNLLEVLEHIQVEVGKPTTFLLSVDEFQKMLVTRNTPQESRAYLKEIVTRIGGLLCNNHSNIFLVAVFGGILLTPLSQVIFTSGHHCKALPIPILSLDQMLNIAKGIDTIRPHVEEQRFKYCLYLIGGWPRILEQFLLAVDNLLVNSNGTEEYYTDAIGTAEQYLDNIYRAQITHEDQIKIQTLLAYSFTGIPVTSWSAEYPKGLGQTFEELEFLGLITKYKVSNATLVAIPPIAVNLCKDDHFNSIRAIKNILKYQSHWQGWEKFCAQLLVVKLSMFHYLDVNSITMTELLGQDAINSPSSNNKLIDISDPGPKYEILEHQYPTYRKENIDRKKVYLNATGAAFDLFIFNGNVMIAGQAKSKVKGKLTENLGMIEYDKTTKAIKNGINLGVISDLLLENVFLVIFANMDSGIVKEDLYESVVVVDHTTHQFFGPNMRLLLH
ncbi:hypothetical protein DLAC_06153 [Tieghemostelium lacteum]|uniref:Crinkler family protein n=1 Tax=Tieghemostelium lacteum TaxID=361077 RepID=A0A151ZHJ8_TIELA|nr:hypothetical protein DLAC_06153 [Tieghemostelium lacteum]|eukprot:KYQ93461.1 hypothetical protein DLAC_06153 [Tieghemostelium lacteum]